jgi:hypothetical protein
MCVVNTPFVNTEKSLFTFVAHQTWTHKKFRQGNDQCSVTFMYLKNKCPRGSDAKTKEGVFVGPQIRELIQNVKSEDRLCETVPRQVESQYPCCLLLDTQRIRSTGKI